MCSRGVIPPSTAPGWLWQGGVAALIATLAMLGYGALHGRRMALTRYSLETPLPVQADEVRIALISDVHMGLTIDEPRLRRELTRLAAEQPDLLVIAGDLVDDRTTPAQMRAACAIVGGFPAKHGVFFVYGNHDLASHGPTPPYTREELDGALTGAGVRILDDQIASAAGLIWLGGMTQGFSRNPDRAPLSRLLETADRTRPIVLVDHQPREMKEGRRSGA